MKAKNMIFFWNRLNQIEQKLDHLLALTGKIAVKELQMAATIDDILAGVTEVSGKDDSVLLILQNALAHGGVPQEKIDAIMAVVEADKAKLQAAIDANTPPV